MKKLLALCFVVMVAGVANCECPVTVALGPHDVILTSYYAHMDISDRPHLTQATANGLVTGPGILRASSDRYPIGHRWEVDGQVVKICGELELFDDGFETGTTDRWARAEGETK